MELLKYIYFLGVVYIVFSIIWFLLATIPKLILTRSISSNIENYILRSVQYYLLCSLTVLTTTASFLENNHISINNGPWFVIIGGIVLFLYLAGKMERNKMMFKFKTFFNKSGSSGRLSYEPHLIGLTIILYALSIKYTFLIDNPINYWFITKIIDFYDTFIIKFIVGFAGIIFLITMIFKGVNVAKNILTNLFSILSGKPIQQNKSADIFDKFKDITEKQNPSDKQQKDVDIHDDIYVDFEELEENEDKEEKP